MVSLEMMPLGYPGSGSDGDPDRDGDPPVFDSPPHTPVPPDYEDPPPGAGPPPPYDDADGSNGEYQPLGYQDPDPYLGLGREDNDWLPPPPYSPRRQSLSHTYEEVDQTR